jgi:hypothetical protein
MDEAVESRDWLSEAIRIIRDPGCLLLPERSHLTALWELYTLTDRALKDLLREVRNGNAD